MTLKQTTAVSSLSMEQGFPYFLAWGTILQGWALAEQGEADEIARILEGVAAYQGTGAESFRLYHLALLAEGYRATGQPDEGLGVIAGALTWADKTDERFYESELYRLKGELLLKQNHSNAAPTQSCFERAIEVARKQSAKSFELRATTRALTPPT
jgi:predicted ATPase